jgi:hypothetical protein
MNIKLTLLVLFTAIQLCGAAEARHLFVIERSKNANIVCYDANPDKSGGLDAKKPVIAYWLLKASDGRKQELTGLDKKAYGFTVVRDTTTSVYTMRIKPLKNKPITIEQKGSDYEAVLEINKTTAVLNKVFVKSSGAGLFTKVKYVELHGLDRATGNPAYEKILP